MRCTLGAFLLGGIMAIGTGCAQPGHGHGFGEARGHDEHGIVDFPISCNQEAHARFETGLGHLHHMMYDEARPYFETAAKADPGCAMAHWGIAMTSFQPLWHPTSDGDLARGKAAVERARALGARTEREAGYIAAVEAFFTDPERPARDRPSDHQARIRAWKQAQRALHEAYPADVDAAAFYALAEVSYAMTEFSPERERSYDRELRAGAILERYFDDHPKHPGLFHYLIHAYDSTKLAPRALEVAQGYDKLAPNSPHALHMPSHIFVRLGYWKETAEWNERSAEAALRHPVNGLTSLHYPHALDYMMYAYLQLGDERGASRTLQRVRAIERAQPHFASAYGIAAAQARYFLEQRKWQEAAQLQPRMPSAVDWQAHPAAEALFHYARGLGAARSGDLSAAAAERERIEMLVRTLREEGNIYWAYMTEPLGKAIGAWILYEQGEASDALALLKKAADLEDSMDKHPITPGEVLPVRELYGEMLLREGNVREAREAFEASLQRTPNRRNAKMGAEGTTAAR